MTASRRDAAGSGSRPAQTAATGRVITSPSISTRTRRPEWRSSRTASALTAAGAHDGAERDDTV